MLSANAARSAFPLFDTILKATADVGDRTLDADARAFFLARIGAVDADAAELFYMLIRVFAAQTDGAADAKTLPFGGRALKRGLKFDLDALPPHLQQMLVHFLRTYLASNASSAAPAASSGTTNL
jgi:hypothetical protein